MRPARHAIHLHAHELTLAQHRRQLQRREWRAGGVDDAEFLAVLALPLGGALVGLLGHGHGERRIRFALHQDGRDLPEAHVPGDDDGAASGGLQLVDVLGTDGDGVDRHRLAVVQAVHVGDRLRVVDEQAERARLGRDGRRRTEHAFEVLLDDAARARHQHVEDAGPERHGGALHRVRKIANAEHHDPAIDRTFEAVAEGLSRRLLVTAHARREYPPKRARRHVGA